VEKMKDTGRQRKDKRKKGKMNIEWFGYIYTTGEKKKMLSLT
jgi:hypothetical protein